MEQVNQILDVIDKARTETKMKIGMLAYWLKLNNKYIVNYVNISFLKKDRSKTIKEVTAIENQPGFLFWANSPEGEAFYTENYNKIAVSFEQQLLKPWVENKYELKRANE